VVSGVGDNSGTDLEIPTGLTDSVLVGVVGRHNNADPSSVRWTVGATVQDAVFVGDVDGTSVGVGLYYVLNPTPGIGNFLASGGAVGLWAGAWVLQNANQTDPISAQTFGFGTGVSSSITGPSSGGTILDAVYVGHDDFVNDGSPAAPIPSAGQTLDFVGALQLGPPGYSDWVFGGAHGDSTPAWTFGQSYPWAGVVIAVGGAGAVAVSDVADSSNPGTDSGFYANADHTHAHGQLTEPSDAHDAVDISVVPFGTIAATNVQAALQEIVTESTSVTDHGALTGLADDDHTQYVLESTLTTAGDMPYASGASTWTRVAIGASNFHLRSDGTKPVWSPESAAGGMSNPMTTAGDIIKGGAAGTPERLAIGGSNFALKSTGSTPEWSNTLRLSYIDLDEHTLGLPPSPPAGAIRLYGSNSKGYYENSSGTVVELGGAGGGGTNLTIEEVDASPSVAATKLVLPNGTLGVVGTVATYTPAAGGSAAGLAPYAVIPGMHYLNTSSFGLANRAQMCHIAVPSAMKLRGLRVWVGSTGSGTHEWGLFDASASATAATKVAGGSGALGSSGAQVISATGAPVDIDPGSYILVWKWPSANAASIFYTDMTSGGANNNNVVFGRRFDPTYTWDDTPDLTAGGWTDDGAVFQFILVGDMDGSGNQW
jgi:hypothetical protein